MFASTFREELARRQGQFAAIYTHSYSGAGIIALVRGDVVVLANLVGYASNNFPIESIHSVLFNALPY